MVETIKYLKKEATLKINGEKTNIEWYVGEGTSGKSYFWTTKNNVTCYIYINKKGKYSNPTFSIITKKYPYGSDEVGYREALLLAR